MKFRKEQLLLLHNMIFKMIIFVLPDENCVDNGLHDEAQNVEKETSNKILQQLYSMARILDEEKQGTKDSVSI